MADNSNENVLSTLLSKEENDLVVTILGNRKQVRQLFVSPPLALVASVFSTTPLQTKATTVIQMFHANPNKTQWSKFSTGVVCFVKDNTQRSYYIRLLDLWVSSLGGRGSLVNGFSLDDSRSTTAQESYL